MSNRPRLLTVPLTVLFLATGVVCGACSGGDNNPNGGHAPILDDAHDGWKWTHCDSCHTLPEAGHTEDRQDYCAQCHGGNGALDPNNPASPKFHGAGEDCTACHAGGHGYSDNLGCVNCHFADDGVDPG